MQTKTFTTQVSVEEDQLVLPQLERVLNEEGLTLEDDGTNNAAYLKFIFDVPVEKIAAVRGKIGELGLEMNERYGN